MCRLQDKQTTTSFLILYYILGGGGGGGVQAVFLFLAQRKEQADDVW